MNVIICEYESAIVQGLTWARILPADVPRFPLLLNAALYDYIASSRFQLLLFQFAARCCFYLGPQCINDLSDIINGSAILWFLYWFTVVCTMMGMAWSIHPQMFEKACNGWLPSWLAAVCLSLLCILINPPTTTWAFQDHRRLHALKCCWHKAMVGYIIIGSWNDKNVIPFCCSVDRGRLPCNRHSGYWKSLTANPVAEAYHHHDATKRCI